MLTTSLRIGYTCHDPLPSSDTNAQQIFWTLLEVARLGADVELFVPSAAAVSIDGGSAIAAYYGASPPAMPSRFRIVPLDGQFAARAAARARFDWRVPRHLAGRPHDLIWTRDPIAAASCARAGLPVVFETHRPDLAVRARFAPWRRLLLPHQNLRGTILHSRIANEAFAAAGVPEERRLVAHNGFAPSHMEPLLDRAQARAHLGLSQTDPIVVYAGHTGRDKGIEALVRMAAGVPAARVILVGVDGGSGEARWIDDLAGEAGATNFRLVTRVPLSEVAAYLYAADVLVIPPTDEPLRRDDGTVLPMKLFTYLAAGRPILAPRRPDIEEVLTDGLTARLVPPNDVSGAAKALAHLLANRSLQDHLGRYARTAAVRYTWAERARRIVKFLERVRPKAKG